MPRDSKWYFVRESDTNEWKAYKSDKPISVGEKTLGAVTTVQGSKSNSSILKVGFDNHETGVALKRSYFEWSRNDLCRKFESSRVNNEAFVQKFKELRSGSRQCLDSSSSSSASDVNLSQDCPAFQMITSTPLSGEASLVPKSSYKSSKRLLEPTVKIRDNVKKKKKTEKETEEAEDDKAFLSRLITEKKKIDGQFSILTELLTSPRSDQLIRCPDDQYWKDLKKELLRRPLPFSAPIPCVVRGLQTNDTFNKQSLDGYVYQTLGGNHRRLAIQDILRDKTLSDAEKDRFKYVHVQLYAELSQVDALRLACLHNKQDEVHAHLCGQDKVKLCRQLKVTYTDNWRKQCSLILGESKGSLEYTFALANLDDEPFCELLDFFQNFENLYIKGQRAPVKVLGLQSKPDFKASAFRDLRGLQSDIVTELLSGLNKKQYSIKEMQLEAVSLKQLKNVKEALLESLGEDDWEKVASSFPQFVTPEALGPFKATVKRGRITPEFNKFVETMTKDQDCQNHNIDTMRLSPPEINYDNLQNQLNTYTGIGMVLLDLPEDWNQETISVFVRQIKAINITKGKAEFGIWIFIKVQEKRKKFFQILAAIDSARENDMKFRVGHAGCKENTSGSYTSANLLQMVIIGSSDKIVNTFGKTFLFERHQKPKELYLETFTDIDKQSVMLCINLSIPDCKNVAEATREKSDVLFIYGEDVMIASLRKHLLLPVTNEERAKDSDITAAIAE